MKSATPCRSWSRRLRCLPRADTSVTRSFTHERLISSFDIGRQFQPMITIGEYTQLFLSIVLGMGLIFEMPILIFFLSLMGIVSAGFMWKNFRYAILIIFVIAAIVTPTPDIVNMCIFAAPMLALYVISIGVAWAVHPKQRQARKEKQAQ